MVLKNHGFTLVLTNNKRVHAYSHWAQNSYTYSNVHVHIPQEMYLPFFISPARIFSVKKVHSAEWGKCSAEA
jgi:hypothetical protein